MNKALGANKKSYSHAFFTDKVNESRRLHSSVPRTEHVSNDRIDELMTLVVVQMLVGSDVALQSFWVLLPTSGHYSRCFRLGSIVHCKLLLFAACMLIFSLQPTQL